MGDRRLSAIRYPLSAALVILLSSFFILHSDGGAQQPLQSVERPPLQSAVEQILGDSRDDWGLMAWSVEDRVPLFAVNAARVMVPASNNKIFTSIWALETLGPEHRFPTELLVTGPIGDDGVLHSDVVLRGSGDPSFGYPDFPEDPMTPLRKMARTLHARGVRRVRGDVVGDASAFDTVQIGPEWPRDTGGGSSIYAPRVSGLAFARNVLWIRLEPTNPGQPAAVHLFPPVQVIPVVSVVRTGGGRAWAVRQEDEDTIHVRGAVSGSRLHRYGVGVAEPALLAADALRQALIAEGIVVDGLAEVGTAPADAVIVHRQWSVPLGRMIPRLNQESDNFFAEHIWKATVANTTGKGSYARGGPASALFFIREAGVPHGQVYQADGSGLSAHNRASAYALVQALTYAHEAPWAELFHRSLAVAADRDGTMRRLFRNTAAAGNLHAKTGFIRGARTLSGYVRTAGGEMVAFSFLYNGSATTAAREIEQKLGTLLADYPGDAAVESHRVR